MRVRAENLTMQFNDAGRVIEIFSDLSLEVPSGTTLAIVGESGAGKTTLLYLLGALEQPKSGKVWIGDTCFQDLEAQRQDLALFRGKNIGFIFQFHNLLPEFDAVENVAMPLMIQGTGWDAAKKRAKTLLEKVGLSHRLNHRPGMLSGGEQQRVAVARAFAGSPGVILADEPTGNLDPRTAADVNNLLHELQRQEGITLIVVTHSLDLARSMDSLVELTSQGLVSGLSG